MHPKSLLIAKEAPYGTGDAARQWWLVAKGTMKEEKWIEPKLEPALFYLWRTDANDEDVVVGMASSHVDDLLLAGQGEGYEKTFVALKEKMQFGTWETKSFRYCRRTVEQAEGFPIKVQFRVYTLQLEKAYVSRADRQRLERKLDAKEHKLLRGIWAKMLWLMRNCRSDLAWYASRGQSSCAKPNIKALVDADAGIHGANDGASRASRFSPNVNFRTCQVIAIGDSAHANVSGVRSQAGHITLLAGPNVFTREGGPISIVDWRSGALKRVVEVF